MGSYGPEAHCFMKVAYCEFFALRREIISFDVASRQIYIRLIPGLSACFPR